MLPQCYYSVDGCVGDDARNWRFGQKQKHRTWNQPSFKSHLGTIITGNLPISELVVWRPFDNRGLFIQPLVSRSSCDIGAPTSMPPRHRPISKEHARSVSTSQTHDLAGCGIGSVVISMPSGVPAIRKYRVNHWYLYMGCKQINTAIFPHDCCR